MLVRSLVAIATASIISLSGISQVHAAKVASLDSGTNLPGVTGIDFVRGDTFPNDETSNRHGTTITRILNQYKPVTDIVSYKIVPGSFTFTPGPAEAALAAALEDPDIKVLDFSAEIPLSLASLQLAANSDRALVTSAGNKAGARPLGIGTQAPLLNNSMVIVGAVDENNNLAIYSNRAGDLAEFYVVAPGFNNFSNTEGTSFAKPHVSGLLALLLWQHPNLSAQDAIRIIKETADDLGAVGVDAVYGWGRVNSERALGPEGDMVIPPSDESSSGGAIILVGAAALIGVAATQVAKKSKDKDQGPLETTLVLDEYDRAYTIDLTEVTQVRPSRGSMSAVLKTLNTLEETHVVDQTTDYTSFMRVTKPTLENQVAYNPTSWLNDDPGFIPEPSMSFYHNTSFGSGYSFHINEGMNHQFGALGLSSTPEDQISFLSNKTFSSPFLGYTTNGYASHMTHAFTGNSSVSFGMSRIDEQTEYGLRSDAAVVELRHRRNRFSGSVYAGQTMEYGSMFGGSSKGIYSVEDTLTLSMGISGAYSLAKDVRVIGNYSIGYSYVDANKQSLMSEFTTLRSDSWGMGLLFDNIFRGRDRVGFAMTQPLKITQGQVTLTVPQSRNWRTNEVSNASDRVDLGGGGRELALETFYRMWVGERARFTTYYMHQRNPNNDVSASSANSILGILEYQF